MGKRKFLPVVALILAACSPGEQSSGVVAYTNAFVWDGTGSPQRQQTVVVSDGRIIAVGSETPGNAEIVDLSGHWIVPGFINSHGHVSGRWASETITNISEQVADELALNARYGVTGILSLGGAPVEAFGLRDSQATSENTRARFYVAGEVVANDTAEAAAALTAENLANGVDWIKLRVDDNLGSGSKMPWDAVQAAIDAADAAGVRVASHIFYQDDARELLARGTGLIAHSVRDENVDEEFVDALMASGVCYVPTLVREVSTFVYAERPDWFDDPFFLKDAKQGQIERVSDPAFMQRMAESPAAAGYRVALKQAKENLRVLVGAGVPIAFGTDSGPNGRFPGYFEHVEFELMAESGMTSREILLSATSVAADCLGLNDVGTLETGKWADFVVLSANPFDDILNTRSIRDVYVAGNRVVAN